MQMGISIMKWLINLIQKGESQQGPALCCPTKRCCAISMGHSCKADGTHLARLSVPWAEARTPWLVCRGDKSAVMLWPGAWAGGLAWVPWVALHHRGTLGLLSHLGCFISEKEAGMLQDTHCIRKDVSITALSVCIIHWTTSLGMKKLTLQRVHRNK